MKRLLVLLLFVAGSAYAVASHAGEQWQWIKASNNIAQGWRTETGKADVTIKGSSFEAVLYWADNPSTPHFTLKGKLSKSRVKATETVADSDMAPSEYSGRYEKQVWKERFENAGGVESITLSDGFNMIGLRRNLK